LSVIQVEERIEDGVEGREKREKGKETFLHFSIDNVRF